VKNAINAIFPRLFQLHSINKRNHRHQNSQNSTYKPTIPSPYSSNQELSTNCRTSASIKMSDINGSVTQKENVNPATAAATDKGKGKSAATEPTTTQDASMDEDDSSDDDAVDPTAPTADEEDVDNMEEIDPSNIIDSGRRTRGRQIDFAKAAKELPEEDEDEDDDDDFEEEAEGDESKMDED